MNTILHFTIRAVSSSHLTDQPITTLYFIHTTYRRIYTYYRYTFDNNPPFHHPLAKTIIILPGHPTRPRPINPLIPFVVITHTVFKEEEKAGCLGPSSHLLSRPLGLSLPLLLQELLLRLGIHSGQLGVALGLALLLTLGRQLLGLFLLTRLLDALDHVIADRLDLAEDLGTEVSDLHELVGHAEEVLEDGQERLVVVVRGEAVLEEDALAGVGLLDTGKQGMCQ